MTRKDQSLATNDKVTNDFMIQIGIPKRFSTSAIEDFSEEIIKVIRSDTRKDGYFITGNIGSGKTHLAAAIVRNALDRIDSETRKDFKLKWKFAEEISLDFKETFSAKHENEKSLLRKYLIDDLLVIDDYGAELITDWSRVMLALIIAKRHDAMRPTIITSNLKLGEINKIDARSASRLSTFIYIKLIGNDRRLENEQN